MYATFVVLVGLMMLAGVVMGVDPRVKGRKGIVVLVYYAVLSYFSIQARAETVFLTETPGDRSQSHKPLRPWSILVNRFINANLLNLVPMVVLYSNPALKLHGILRSAKVLRTCLIYWLKRRRS